MIMNKIYSFITKRRKPSVRAIYGRLLKDPGADRAQVAVELAIVFCIMALLGWLVGMGIAMAMVQG